MNNVKQVRGVGCWPLERMMLPITLIACAMLCGVLLAGCGAEASYSGGASVDSSPEANESVEEEPDNLDDVQEESADSAMALSLESDEHRTVINTRLSWMAQVFSRDSGSVDLDSANTQARFAIQYIGIVDGGEWVPGDYQGFNVKGGGANGTLNERLAIPTIEYVVNDYFGKEFEASQVKEPYASDGQNVYFGVTAPPGQTAAYSAATSIEALGTDRYRLEFDVFEDGYPYERKHEAFYQLDAEGMMEALEMPGASVHGEAVVRVTSEGVAPHVVFEEYETSAR